MVRHGSKARRPGQIAADTRTILAGLDKRFDGLDKRIDSLDNRMDRLDHRMDRFEDPLDQMLLLGLAASATILGVMADGFHGL